MLVKVLKAFPYSENGRSPQYLEPSDDPDARVDIRDDLCPGLSGEGYIDGVEHSLPLLSEGRRSAILDRIVARGRADLAKLGDERLLEMAAQLDALVAAESATDAPAPETKIEPPLEQGAPQPIEPVAAPPADAPAADEPPADEPAKGRKAKADPAGE
jgi:hypothetical protein